MTLNHTCSAKGRLLPLVALVLSLPVLVAACGGGDGDLNGDALAPVQTTQKLTNLHKLAVRPDGDYADTFALVPADDWDSDDLGQLTQRLSLEVKQLKGSLRVSVACAGDIPAEADLRLVFAPGTLHPASVEFSREISEAALTLAPLTLEGELPLVWCARDELSASGTVAEVYFEGGPFRSAAVSVDQQLWKARNVSLQRGQKGIRVFWAADVPGDYNGDSTVSGQDLFALIRELGSSSIPEQGEFSEADAVCSDGNSDGIVDSRDIFPIAGYFNFKVDALRLFRAPSQWVTSNMFEDIPMGKATPAGIDCRERGFYIDYDYPFADAEYYAWTIVPTGGGNNNLVYVNDFAETYVETAAAMCGDEDVVLEGADRFGARVPAGAVHGGESVSIGYIENFGECEHAPTIGRAWTIQREQDEDFDSPVTLRIPVHAGDYSDIEFEDLALAVFGTTDEPDDWVLMHPSDFEVTDFPDGSGFFTWETTEPGVVVMPFDQGPLRVEFEAEMTDWQEGHDLLTILEVKGGAWPYTNIRRHDYGDDDVQSWHMTPGRRKLSLKASDFDIWVEIEDDLGQTVATDPLSFSVPQMNWLVDEVSGPVGVTMHTGLEFVEGTPTIGWYTGDGDRRVRISAWNGTEWITEEVYAPATGDTVEAMELTWDGRLVLAVADTQSGTLSGGILDGGEWSFQQFTSNYTSADTACMAIYKYHLVGLAYTTGGGAETYYVWHRLGAWEPTEFVHDNPGTTLNPGGLSFGLVAATSICSRGGSTGDSVFLSVPAAEDTWKTYLIDEDCLGGWVNSVQGKSEAMWCGIVPNRYGQDWFTSLRTGEIPLNGDLVYSNIAYADLYRMYEAYQSCVRWDSGGRECYVYRWQYPYAGIIEAQTTLYVPTLDGYNTFVLEEGMDVGYYPDLRLTEDDEPYVTTISADGGRLRLISMDELPFDGDTEPPWWPNGVGVQRVEPRHNGFTVYFNAAVDDRQDGNVGYTLYRDTQSPVRVGHEDVYKNSLSDEIESDGEYDYKADLPGAPDQTYYVLIRANDASPLRNYDDNTVELSVTPFNDDQPPVWTGDIGARLALGPAEASWVYWDEVSDDSAVGAFLMYVDTQSPVRFDSQHLAKSFSAKYALPGRGYAHCYQVPEEAVTDGVTNYVVIRARDEHGNVEQNTVEASWLPAADSTPPSWDSTIGVQDALSGDGTVTLFFNAASDDTSPVTDYWLYRDTETPIDTSGARNAADIGDGGPYFDYSVDTGSYEYVASYHHLVRALDRALPANLENNAVEVYCQPAHWEVPALPEGVNGDLSLTYDSSDNIHALYRDDETTGLVYAVESAGGFDASIVTNGGIQRSAIALTADDQPRLAFFRWSEVNAGWMACAAMPDGETFEVTELSIVGPDLPVESRICIAVDGLGYTWIAYLDPAANQVMIANHDGASWNVSALAGSAGGGEWLSLAIDADGSPAIAWRSETRDALELARFTGNWEIETVDGSPNAGEHCSLAFDALGNPVIADCAGSSRQLRLATFDGTQWSIEILDTRGNAADRIVLGYDRLGLAHVFYHNELTGRIEHLHHIMGEWRDNTLAGGYADPGELSLDFDAAGLPAIGLSSIIKRLTTD